jgi:predicted acetyltransferase
MEFRTVLSKADQIEAIELSKSIFKPNMAEQFTLLFGESNWNHMFIAVDQGKIVSLVNYYPSFVQIENCIIKVASIGSVCTKAEYRGQKLASRLLILAENQIKKEAIDLVIISGGGGIYTEFGSSLAGNINEYLFNESSLDDSEEINIELFDQSYLPTMISIQNHESIRFIRKENEFDQLLSSQTFPDSFATYPIHVIKQNHQTLGYIVGILPTDGDEFGIKEFAGNRKAIIKSFKLLLSFHKRNKIHFACDVHDEINDLLRNQAFKRIHQHASFKIIDFCAFMKKLSPYFDTIYPNHGILFDFKDNHATFTTNDEIFTVESSILLSQLILGFDQPLNLQLANHPNISQFFNKVFPIPFAWTNNINYQ